ncbi:MAG TPA: glycine cleavage system protein H [Terriglobales bacterium]|nr:glycine cleavage system protein H [Terriglobales bacterium]
MSILFVLLMFLLIMSISYLRRPQEVQKAELPARPKFPRIERELGFEIPQGYCFHPGHTWVSKESPENARIGLDTFVSGLVGGIDRIETIAPNRWIRQGQKFATIHGAGTSIDMLSPVEGVVTAVNSEVVQDPTLLARDPYNAGWIAMVKSPDLALNQKNLVQGPMIAPWMQNSVTRLNAMLTQLAPAYAQDGGVPVRGLLQQLPADLRQNIVKELFLS